MRIVHYLSSIDLKDGGVVRAVLDLCPALAAAGHEVVLLTHNAADVPPEWTRASPWAISGAPACVPIAPPTLPGGVLGGEAMARVREVVGGADVVHIHALWNPSNNQVARACRVSGTPYVVSPHGMLDDWCMARSAAKKRVYYALFERRMLRAAAVIHCTAEAELQQAGKWFPPGRGVVVPLPFDLSDYRDLPGPAAAREKFGLPNDNVILYLSRIHPKKGVDVLIDAAADLRSGGRPVTLVIAGGGDESYVQSLRQRADRAGIGAHVKFVGFVKGREKVSLYQAATAFVLPSSQENFGYVVVEAMAAATPVITTRGVALWPQLQRADAAVLVEPTRAEVAAAIQGLLSDPGGAVSLGQRGRGWCLREMDQNRIIDGFVSMYRKAASSRRPVDPATSTRESAAA